MTRIVETNTNADAKMLAAMLKRLDFVKTVSITKAKTTVQPKKLLAASLNKNMTDEDWVLQGRAATNQEIDKMLDECEKDSVVSSEKSKKNNFGKFKTWQKKSPK